MIKDSELPVVGTSAPETVVITNIDTLKSAFKQWVDEETSKRQTVEQEVMLHETTVRKMLGKSHSTLWRWHKSGYLPCYKNGGRNVYKLSDVERIRKCIGKDED